MCYPTYLKYTPAHALQFFLANCTSFILRCLWVSEMWRLLGEWEVFWSDNSFANEDDTSSPVQTAQEQENWIYLHRSWGINEQGLHASHKSSTGVFYSFLPFNLNAVMEQWVSRSPASTYLPAAHCSVLMFFYFHGLVMLEYAYLKVKVLRYVFQAILAGLNLLGQPDRLFTSASPRKTKHLEHFMKQQTQSLPMWCLPRQ